MSIVPSMCVPERNQHSRGYRVNLAVRQDSLNGVWISSEKSSRRLNSRTTVKWRSERERERKRAKGRKRGERETVQLEHKRRFAFCATSPCSSAYITLWQEDERREKDERRRGRNTRETECRAKGGENTAGYRELSRSRPHRGERSVSFFPSVSIEKIFLHSV